MKNLWKKILCFVFPIMMVAMIATGLIATYKMRNMQEDEEKTSIGNAQSPIYYASAEDTGASTASSSEKGGAIYLGENSVYTMKNGTISGHSNTYGGAIYVSNGAVLTMTGGTISNNTATYGGAIYIENGGRCDITGGTITGNKADNAPAIYVEEGGQLNISGTAVVENNTTPINTIVLSFDFAYGNDNDQQDKGVFRVEYLDGETTKKINPYSDKAYLTIEAGLSWYEVIEKYNFTFTIYSGTDSTGKKLYTDGYWSLNSDNPTFEEDTDIIFIYVEFFPCFDVETEILCYDEKKKRYYKKKLKDVTYNDKIVVWNFDKGCMDIAEPLFLTKSKFAHRYTEITFSDGSMLKLVGENDAKRHRIFNVETGKFEYVGTNMKLKTITLNAKGEKVTVESIRFVDAEIEYASIMTAKHINCFAGNILTTASGRMSHLYEIKDMKFVKEPRDLVDSSEYPEIDKKYFDGLRLSERKLATEDIYINDYVKFVNDWKSRSK